MNRMPLIVATSANVKPSGLIPWDSAGQQFEVSRMPRPQKCPVKVP